MKDGIQLYCGDCLEVMKQIPDGSVDMVLCDLPYGTTACKWDAVIPFEPMWEQYERVVKNIGAIVLFGQEPFSSALRLSNARLFRYDWIWEKQRPSNFQLMNHQCGRVHETISVFSKSNACHSNGKPTMVYNPQITPREKPRVSAKNTIYGNNILHKYSKTAKRCNEKKTYNVRLPTSIIRFNTVERGKMHPTEKPVDLLKYLIRTYTFEGETVLDNCMGSGSTGVACVETGRNFVGIEKEQKYFDVAKTRIAKAQTMPQQQELGL